MAGGGKQPGAGRPKGSLSAVSQRAKIAAMETGLLPHEWLLKVSRGEAITHNRLVVIKDAGGNEVSRGYVSEEHYADFETRIDAAKAAAPFYSAKLLPRQTESSSDAIVKAMLTLADNLPL